MTIAALLASYLAAKAQHAEAGHQVLRAERIAEKLAKRHGGSEAAWARACKVAGFDLADQRNLAAWRDMVLAGERLQAALRGAPVATRLRAIGVVLCADLLRPPNVRNTLSLPSPPKTRDSLTLPRLPRLKLSLPVPPSRDCEPPKLTENWSSPSSPSAVTNMALMLKVSLAAVPFTKLFGRLMLNVAMSVPVLAWNDRRFGRLHAAAVNGGGAGALMRGCASQSSLTTASAEFSHDGTRRRAFRTLARRAAQAATLARRGALSTQAASASRTSGMADRSAVPWA